MSNYNYCSNGLRVGDYISYYIIQPNGWRSSKERSGIVLNRKYLFSNMTFWGERKFFNYKIYDDSNRLITIDTRNIKMIKYVGVI